LDIQHVLKGAPLNIEATIAIFESNYENYFHLMVISCSEQGLLIFTKNIQSKSIALNHFIAQCGFMRSLNSWDNLPHLLLYFIYIVS